MAHYVITRTKMQQVRGAVEQEEIDLLSDLTFFIISSEFNKVGSWKFS